MAQCEPSKQPEVLNMKRKVSLVPSNLPAEIKDIATAIAQGQVKNATMEWRSDGSVAFAADSPDGKARILIEKVQFSGVTKETKISISEPTDLEERLQRVKVLRERGMTQQEISKYTMTSQKTVSNDIQRLKRRREILTK